MRFFRRPKNKDVHQRKKKDDLGISERELFRRLEIKGCPVCGVLEHHDRRYLAWFSIEKYHETGFVESLTRALGFCAKHGAYLDQKGHWASQITAVHKYAASHARKRLSAVKSKGKNDFGTLFRDRISCPVCTSYHHALKRTLWSFKKMMQEKESPNKYGRPGILCFPHFKEITGSASSKLFAKLLSSHEAAMISTTDALETIRGKESKITVESEQIRNALSLSVGREQNPGNSLFLSRIYKISETGDPMADFIASLKKNMGCPICLDIYGSLSQWISWLDKNIKSTDNFEAMRDVLPTCNTHVWSCVRLGGPELQFAATFAGLRAAQEKVNNAVRHLKQMTKIRKPFFRKQKANEKQSHQGVVKKVNPKNTITSALYCPICSRIDVAKKRALNLLLALLQERRYRKDFEKGYGLCIKHFADAFDMQPADKIGRFLIRVESAKLTLLEWELEEAMRKTAWTVRPESIGSEQSAWHRGLARFSGLPILG
jgi:hypothetical protein